ncbi:MAG: substrate-binding domain-containing protein [Clostridiales Family XIII bacterium]|jgi:ribose transport system substrate-binding protein|nr:substrate-binding domain-containing protein [Clostridiales Family XIII bacterium]
MKKKVLSLSLALILVLGLLLAGCKDEKANQPIVTEGQIIVLVPEAAAGWDAAVVKYAQEEAAAMTGGITAEVRTSASAKDQIAQIDSICASTTPPAGVIVYPYDKTLESSMSKLADSGIPFLQFERIFDTEAVNSDVVANIKGDITGVGKEVALRFINDGMEPGDKTFVLVADTSADSDARKKGFTAILLDNGWTEQQISENIVYSRSAENDRAAAQQIFTEWIAEKSVEELAQYHYVFANTDEMALGILQALAGDGVEQAKKDIFLTSTMAMGSSQGVSELYRALDGTHENAAYPNIIANIDVFSVTYDPAMIKTAMRTLVSYLGGEKIVRDHTLGVEIVDYVNASEYPGY